ncbi:MAG TPA: hypothetical protein VFR32_02680 [Gaiellaceae bacterium]|nr:hypothetical protein [Gaiellaceae bacterium]
MGALACGALFALAARLSAGDLPGPTSVAAVAGVAALATGLVLRRGAIVTAGLVLLGTGYGLALADRTLDPAAGLYAGALVLTAELAFWALEPGAAVRLGRTATARKALVVTTIALGATVAGTLLLLAVADPVAGGAALAAAGIGALASILVLAAVLGRSLRSYDR